MSAEPAGATATRPQATLAVTEASLTTTAKLEAMALAVSCAVRTCAARSPLPRTSSSSVPCSCAMTLRPACSGGTRLMPLPAARIARKEPLASLIQPSAPVRSVLPGPMTSPRTSVRGRAPGSALTTLAAPAVSTTSHSSAPSPAVCQAIDGGLSNTVSLAVRSPAAARGHAHNQSGPGNRSDESGQAAGGSEAATGAAAPGHRRRHRALSRLRCDCQDRMAIQTQMQSVGEARYWYNLKGNRRYGMEPQLQDGAGPREGRG